MIKPIADLLTEPGQSRYALCVGVAKRAREVQEQAEQTNTILEEKPVEVAVEELWDHEYRIVESDRNEDEEADAEKEARQAEVLAAEMKADEELEEEAQSEEAQSGEQDEAAE